MTVLVSSPSMGIVIRQSIWTTFFAYVGVIVGYLNSLILYPKVLSNEEIGLIRTLISASMLVAPIALLGLTSMVLRYVPKYRSDKTKLGLIFSNYSIGAFFGIGLTVTFLVFLRDPITAYYLAKAPDLLGFLDIALTLIIFTALVFFAEYWAKAHSLMVLPNFLKDVFLRIGITILLLFTGWKIIEYEDMVSFLPWIYFLSFFILLSFLAYRRLLRFKLSFLSIIQIDSKELWSYSLLSIVGSLGSLIVLNIDIQMVSGMLGLAATGIYTTCFYMAVVIEIPQRAITQVMTPIVSRDISKNNFQKVKHDFKKISIYQACIGFLLFLGIVSNLPNIFYLIPRGTDFQAGSNVVIIIGLSKVLNMLFSNGSSIIIMSKYYKFHLIAIFILGISTIILNYLLITPFGIVGAALATFIATFIFNITKYIFIKLKFGFSPFSKESIKLFLIAAATLGLHFVLPKLSWPIADLFYRSISILIFYSYLVWRMNITPEFNQKIAGLKRSLWRK